MKIFEISLKVKIDDAERSMRFMAISETPEDGMAKVLEQYNFKDVEVMSYSVDESDDTVIFLSSTSADEQRTENRE